MRRLRRSSILLPPPPDQAAIKKRVTAPFSFLQRRRRIRQDRGLFAFSFLSPPAVESWRASAQTASAETLLLLFTPPPPPSRDILNQKAEGPLTLFFFLARGIENLLLAYLFPSSFPPFSLPFSNPGRSRTGDYSFPFASPAQTNGR